MFVQITVMKRSRKQERRQTAVGEKDIQMSEHKEQESCKMAPEIASISEQQKSTKLIEIH